MFVTLVLGLLATTAQASSGPETAERATPVAMPIRAVVVFSDRARVTRRGAFHFDGGAQVLRAPDLPGATMPGTIRVTATGSNVIRVETRPIERERFGIDQVDAWIALLEALIDEEAVVRGKLAAVRGELGLLQGLLPAPPLPEKDRAGRPLVAAPEGWKEAEDRLAKRRSAARDRERRFEEDLRALSVERQRLQREIDARDVGGFADTRLEVIVIVDGGAGDGTLSVEYAIPGASWKPAYDLLFDPEKGTVQLATAGVVSQASGEDWTETKLSLSTAIPGEDLSLPKLRTWTLGDDREFVPLATARTVPPVIPLFAPPTPRTRATELESDADRALLKQRIATLSTLVHGAADGRPDASGDRREKESDDATGDRARDAMSVRKRSGPPPRPPAATAPTMQSLAPPPSEQADDRPLLAPGLQMEAADEDVTSSQAPAMPDATRRVAAAATAGGLRLLSRDAWRRPTFSDPFLPAVSAAGFDVVFDAPLPATVLSQAQALRVPLSVRETAVTTFFEATPALSKTAFLKATVKNGTGLPILAGPANVFVGGAFTGDAVLKTTGPGGTIELPLGADEDIRLTRTVIPASSTKGLVFGERDVTDYAVKIEVGNYKKRPITIRVVDQIPKSANEKVEITLLSVSPQPQTDRNGANVDGDGLLAFVVDVPAGGAKTLAFAYRVARPKDWRLSQ